ncbi:MAG: saccharopine dehydrogenase C-terminal domain-containing protein [Bacteroidota bacterium]|nr:saccharopine dehydrogenase C-terminal domain-containing protein [Bacteroidota bacterium]
MKNIVLFGAGKSATCLIDYLSRSCQENQWMLTVADANADVLNKKLSVLPAVQAAQVNVQNPPEWTPLIEKADLVISLLPPALHILIARTCLLKLKNLLTASYIDAGIESLQKEIEAKGLLFLCEMGLDPGIDHMSAMVLIDRITAGNGHISSFRSHTGGLVAPESDDNPWHYKISWNPRNVVRAGSAGAIYKENRKITQIGYQHIFENTGMVSDRWAGTYAFYPNRDALAYMPIYGLEDADTFIRTTLRHPDFCRGWKDIVASGLTDDQQPISASVKTIADWSQSLRSRLNGFNRPLFDFLGLFENNPLPKGVYSSADVLQQLIEKKWEMRESDKDMIVMLHELEYTVGQKKHSMKSSLVVIGEDHLRTAMAKTVGLPLGIAARLVLENKIQLKGLHIPIIPEIYLPVLKELDQHGIRFHETVS